MNKQRSIFKLMILTLYLIQGMFYGYVYSLPLAYPSIPNYYILGLFGLSALPFSFKFIIAPFIQRYHHSTYGKRKTWIVSTILLCSMIMIPMGAYSEEQNQTSQKVTALLLFGCILCIAAKDVAADSLSVSTLDSGFISLATFVGDQIGKLITLPFFLACISPDFFSQYGLDSPLISASSFIQLTAAFGIIVTLIIHFFFNQQKTIQSSPLALTPQTQQQIEEEHIKSSFSSIFQHYKKFISPQYRLFRVCLLLCLINQGTEIFMESYPVELIKSGVHRETLMLAQNLCLIPNIIASLAISRFVNEANYEKYFYFCTIAKFCFIIFLYFSGNASETTAIGLYVLLYIIGSIHYFLENVLVAEESRGKFSGLSITLLLSISNLSRLTVLQKMVIDQIGYNSCINICLIFSSAVIVLLPTLSKWTHEAISLRWHSKND